MKKLISLIGAGVLFFGRNAIAQEIKPETDMFKYIPRGSHVIAYDLDNNGTLDIFWYDKNKDGKTQENELFFDVTDDSIPDMDCPTFQEYMLSKEKEDSSKI
ncbi:hypothetical protein M0R72_04815 [Candidatus Pacearchaeota archaeon]|jgi:hypothetical protein|nr:hypothetical protein [Candidatus Pacearchaeota archaeon]